jgi:hypothetical protein
MLINLINFNLNQFVLITKYRVHTLHVILTYSATILARWKTPDNGRIQPNHVNVEEG